MADKFCNPEQNDLPNFVNAKNTFECEVEEFRLAIKQRNIDRGILHPIFEWGKIDSICAFVSRKGTDKNAGL